MEPAFRKHGKIAHGMTGAGTVTAEMVEQRAKELALVNGRDRFNEDDLREARIELVGLESPDDVENDDLVGSSLPYGNPGSTGVAAPKITPRDEQTEAGKMIDDGMEEAQHDTMVKGARSTKNQE